MAIMNRTTPADITGSSFETPNVIPRIAAAAQTPVSHEIHDDRRRATTNAVAATTATATMLSGVRSGTKSQARYDAITIP